MTATPPRGRWIARAYSAATVVLLAAVAWRLGPHLAAVVGLDLGARDRPRYSLVTLDGAGTPAAPAAGDASLGPVVTDATLQGRVVLVNAWATWCLPCRAEMPLLEQMWQRHRAQGFVVLGLSADTLPPAMVRAWMVDRGLTFPAAIGTARDFGAFGGVSVFPTSFLLDRAGRVRHKVVGPIGALSLEFAVRRLLEEPRRP
jgi:cytochrome c biogenesis protein CcmG/thiol:disulfide interchange protein DsbE